MAVSWEIQNTPRVLTAILHVETTTVAWSLGLKQLVTPGPVLPLTGMPFDHARNEACQHAKQNGFHYIFFLDSDVVAPPDTILRLIARNEPFISGIYHRRSPPHGIPVMLKNGRWITKYPQNKVIEVDLVGAGCLLLRRDFLESIPPQRPGKPWFDWRVDMKEVLPPDECLSEDFTLNLWARKHGWKVKVDTSIQCRHIGFGEAVPDGMIPLNTHPIG